MSEEKLSCNSHKKSWLNKIFPVTLAVASLITMLSCNNPKTWDANQKEHAKIEQMDTTNEKKVTSQWYAESNADETDVFNWWYGNGDDKMTDKDVKSVKGEVDVFNGWYGNGNGNGEMIDKFSADWIKEH